MRGRKPKPTELKLVTGNPGRRPLPKNEPKTRGPLGGPPKWMTDEQRGIWEEAIKEAPLGVLTASDRHLFTTWVCAVNLHRKAAMEVGEQGITLTTTNGNIIQSPCVGAMNTQAQIIMRASSELGFSPVSRSRVTVPDEGNEKEEDPAAKYFN